MQSFFNKLLDLPQTEVTGYQIDGNKLYLEVQSTFDEVPCRQCGKKTKSKGYAEKREIRHLPMNDKECYLVIKAKREICESCDDNTLYKLLTLTWY